MKSKEELIEDLNRSMQRAGTLTVLHTNAVAAKVGLSATEFEAIDVIRHDQPMSAGKLALHCGLTTGAITGIVDRLEHAGFVRRMDDPQDRRRVLLQSVEDSKRHEVIRELYAPMGKAFHAIAMDCTVEQLQFLVAIHKKMNDVTETIIADMRKK